MFITEDGCIRPGATLAALAGLKPAFREDGVVTAGVDPALMGMGPVPASTKALAGIRELGLNEDTINLDGGGMAIGHPPGATGARITGKAAQQPRRTGGRYALATPCIGGGQGIATVLAAV